MICDRYANLQEHTVGRNKKLFFSSFICILEWNSVVSANVTNSHIVIPCSSKYRLTSAYSAVSTLIVMPFFPSVSNALISFHINSDHPFHFLYHGFCALSPGIKKRPLSWPLPLYAIHISSGLVVYPVYFLAFFQLDTLRIPLKTLLQFRKAKENRVIFFLSTELRLWGSVQSRSARV